MDLKYLNSTMQEKRKTSWEECNRNLLSQLRASAVKSEASGVSRLCLSSLAVFFYKKIIPNLATFAQVLIYLFFLLKARNNTPILTKRTPRRSKRFKRALQLFLKQRSNTTIRAHCTTSWHSKMEGFGTWPLTPLRLVTFLLPKSSKIMRKFFTKTLRQAFPRVQHLQRCRQHELQY